VDGDPHDGCVEDIVHADFGLFVKAHGNSLFLPVARRYTGFRGILDAAPDVVQEALIRAWPRWPGQLALEPCRRRCAWLCKTMSYVASEEQRRRARGPKLTAPTALHEKAALRPGPEDRYVMSEVVQVVAHALASLRPTERAIIDLAIAKVPHAEIAEQLGLPSASTVSTRLHRARIRLARHLDADVLAELDLDPSGGAA
jgi:RNA polymerase sigma factor (sigma-70 family)